MPNYPVLFKNAPKRKSALQGSSSPISAAKARIQSVTSRARAGVARAKSKFSSAQNSAAKSRAINSLNTLRSKASSPAMNKAKLRKSMNMVKSGPRIR